MARTPDPFASDGQGRPPPSPAGTPRLSVLMPSWNAATSIERAVASILEATDVDLECIVIDDGSTDGTAAVVAKLAERDPRVVLVALPENAGVSHARNRGLAIARGEWLAFLDADDRLLPGGVRALMRPTADPDVRIVAGQRIWTDGERTWLSKVYDIPDITQPGRKSLVTHPGLLYYASATGKVIHRSLVEGLTFQGRVLGDQPWTIRAMLRAGGGIEVIGDVVYEWTRPHPDRYVETIGAATRASADRAAAMAAMAPLVYGEVSAEIDERIADDMSRVMLKQAYFDRLVRSDLGPTVTGALDRRDPATDRLYAAVAAFLDAVPIPTRLASGALVRSILRPPARRWRSLQPAARPSYWAMVRPLLAADAGMVRRIGGLACVPAFGLVRLLGAPVGTAAASGILALLSLARTAARRGRRDGAG